MFKYAANLSLLWPELHYLDRFEAAAQAGFNAVEILFPYDLAVKETKAALDANDLELVLINAPPPNYTGGPRGFAAEPEMSARFEKDITRAFRFAEALGASFIHVMAGTAEGPAAQAMMVRNLSWAAARAPEGMTLTLEPLNPQSMPGYFLNNYDLAANILSAIDAPNVALQYDSFHAQMIHGDAVATFERHRDLVAHVQFGDAPDRSPPGSGTVDFPALLDAMKTAQYVGWVSGEYHPGAKTEKTLDWMKKT